MNKYCEFECVDGGKADCALPSTVDRVVGYLALAREHAMSIGLGHQIPTRQINAGSMLAGQDSRVDACIAEHRAAQEA